MKKIFLYPPLFLLLLFVQCSPENEEDLYYEPLVDGIYNISVDQEEVLEFTIEPHKATKFDGQFSNGISFSLEFEAGSMRFNEAVEASIQPVTGLLNMPSEYQFKFGFVFSPDGVEFSKPGKMTVELPPDIDIGEFKGFYFAGGVPYGNSDPQIWGVMLTPLLFHTEGGKKQAVFEIPHFSGFVGVSGGDFKCGNPKAAENCAQLKEILACYITGKETISSDDQQKVNRALKDWLDYGLDWLDQHPEEMDEEWEIEFALQEILCWKASALMFNSTLSPFQNQLDRVGDLFTRMLVDRVVEMNNECLAMSETYEQASSFGLNGYFISLLDDLRNAGMIDEDPGIDIINYCDGIATKFYMEPFLYDEEDHIRHLYGPNWGINFGPEADPAVARTRRFNVFATNLLGESDMLTYEKDYTISIINIENYIFDGTAITEELITCWRKVGETEIPYPCYPQGGVSFQVILNGSKDAINVQAGRNLW